MSRRMRRTSPGLGSLAAFLSAVILPLSTSVHARTDSPVSAVVPSVDRFQLCSTVLQARSTGGLQTSSTPGGEFSVSAGLWVGAEVDRGNGLEQIVSTTLYTIEFLPVDATQLPGAFGEFRKFYADTSSVFVPHEPLGLRVTQVASAGQRPGYGGFVRFHFDVKNISNVWSPPGWDMEHVYLGMFADPDVGLQSAAQPWSDDFGAYASTADGGLGYVWDAAGSGDDTSARAGVLLPGQEVHSFQVWASAEDDADDAAQYALLRGNGHDVQTIDPPSSVPSDQRILVSVGPFTIPRGAFQSFDVAIVCGDALPPPGFEAAPLTMAPMRMPALVTPNPVSRAASSVRFADLAAGATVSIYDASGRLVTSIVGDAAGVAKWDLASGGSRVPAGVYLYRVAHAEGARTGKLVVVR